MKILNIFLLLLNSKAQATDEWPLVSTDYSANLTAQVTYSCCNKLASLGATLVRNYDPAT